MSKEGDLNYIFFSRDLVLWLLCHSKENVLSIQGKWTLLLLALLAMAQCHATFEVPHTCFLVRFINICCCCCYCLFLVQTTFEYHLILFLVQTTFEHHLNIISRYSNEYRVTFIMGSVLKKYSPYPNSMLDLMFKLTLWTWDTFLTKLFHS